LAQDFGRRLSFAKSAHLRLRSAILMPSIRLATAADTAALMRLVNDAFAIETFLQGSRTDEQGLAELMEKGVFLVAEGVQQPIIASVYVDPRGERAYFGMLAVDPSQQGTGLGRLMTEAAEDYCRQRGSEQMDITVLSLRPELLPFYRKLGYQVVRTEAFHPSRPLADGVECHCIVMSKAL